LLQLRLLDSSTCSSLLFRNLLLPWRRRLLVVVVSGRPPPSTLTDDDGHAPLLRFGKSSSRSCATSSSSRPSCVIAGSRAVEVRAKFWKITLVQVSMPRSLATASCLYILLVLNRSLLIYRPASQLNWPSPSSSFTSWVHTLSRGNLFTVWNRACVPGR
jgi:hypothetical protein